MAGFATSDARSLTASRRVVALPPPPAAGVRTLERLRGEFDDNLPTLRLPRIGTRVLLREMAAARKLALQEQAQPSDGVPIAIVPDSTHELSMRDVEVDEDRGVEAEIEIDESAQLDTSDLWPMHSAPLALAPPIVSDDASAPRIVVLRERTAVYPRLPAAPPVQVSLTPLLRASLGTGFDETALLELEAEPPPSNRRLSLVLGFAMGAIVVLVAAMMWPASRKATVLEPALADLDQPIALAPIVVGPPRLVRVGGPPPVIAAAPVVTPPSLATPPDPRPVVALAAVAPAPVVAKRPRVRREPVERVAPAIVAAPAPTPARPVDDGAALLREAERAFASGRHATALLYADRSRVQRNDPRATRIAALAACRLGRVAKAEAAWNALPLGQRTSVRNACREQGVVLGGPTASTTPRS